MKNTIFVLTFFLAIIIVGLTVFSPILIAIWYSNPIWLFLYFVVWTAVILEVLFFAGILSIMEDLLD